MPRLSVVIPSASRPDLLSRCLASVKEFAPSDTEVVVVDDASERGCISEVACANPNVRVIRLNQRSGFCVAANIGVMSAEADVVELLNDDTEVAPGWADEPLKRFADRNVVAVAPLVLQLDPERTRAGLPTLIDSAGDDYDYGGFATKRYHNSELLTAQADLQNPQPVWGVSASAAFYRRETILQAGLFPTAFGAYFEDVDLSHRLKPFGQVWFDPTSVVWHRVSSSYGKTLSPELMEQQSRNEELVFWRNVRGWQRWKFFPRHVGVLVAKAFRRWREGRLTPWLHGRWLAWQTSTTVGTGR
jgi:GT2 family glycosyltransferase